MPRPCSASHQLLFSKGAWRPLGAGLIPAQIQVLVALVGLGGLRWEKGFWEASQDSARDSEGILLPFKFYFDYFLREGVTLSPRLECGGAIVAHYSLNLLGSREPLALASE